MQNSLSSMIYQHSTYEHSNYEQIQIFSKTVVRDKKNSLRQNKISTSANFQSKAIRKLLQQILLDNHIDDELDDSSFPYTLKKTGALVSFSHSSISRNQPTSKTTAQENNNQSQTHLVIALTNSQPTVSNIGIDTELRPITMSVVSRFFAESEKAFIQPQAEKKKKLIASRLWMAKEAYIKAAQLNLIQGLSQDMSRLFSLEKLLDSLDSTDSTLLSSDKSEYEFIWLPQHQSMLCVHLDQRHY